MNYKKLHSEVVWHVPDRGALNEEHTSMAWVDFPHLDCIFESVVKKLEVAVQQ